MNQEKHITEKIGRRIRKLREVRKLSQMELAANARIDKSYLGDVERGKANISVRLVARIADALDVRVSEFFIEQRNSRT